MAKRTLLMRGIDLLICSRTTTSFSPNPNYKKTSLFSVNSHFINFINNNTNINSYTSKSRNHKPNYSENQIQNQNPVELEPEEEEDVTSAKLKTQIDKFYQGDIDAIPTIFESILKRKLAGKHDESDDELMNEFRQGQPSEVGDEESDSLTSSDSDSD
ncbi:uncharacterized protein [Rutidosis leptorrhynchoides]|uniref:uncharacterized protein n=1 Tax=Rutidosis leptorrhynchoides TaxID=125765 RepID=UPI003A994843